MRQVFQQVGDRACAVEAGATLLTGREVFPERERHKPLVPVEEEVDVFWLDVRLLHWGLKERVRGGAKRGFTERSEERGPEGRRGKEEGEGARIEGVGWVG